MITSRAIARHVLTGSFLLLFTSGCLITSNMVNFWPLHYRPSCDVKPVLTIKMPSHIETLAACPRDETLALNGRSVKEGEKWCDDIKEFFYYRNGKGGNDWDVRYEFIVFFNEASAVARYGSETRGRWESKHYPVYSEVVTNDCSACVHYTEQERADPEGGSVPMGIYHARASFRLHNAFIRVTTTEPTAQSDKLADAVRDLAQMLTAALSNTNRVPQ